MDQPIVVTTAGRVQGVRENGVSRFLAVPYAASPLGPRRFKLPEPPVPWEGVRDAGRYGPCAPQIIREFKDVDLTPLVGDGWVKGDDFLNANIWTPDVDSSGLPVMVFIHGGAFVAGRNSAAVQDGTAFARSGVVLISINYRMGVEGFVPIPGAPANLGLHDQLEALRWVRANARAFGGDPQNVTVFGESAGAMSVANLVASPLAEGLFQKAIVESGHGDMVRPVRVAERLTRRLAKLMRVPPDLRGFSASTVEAGVAAQERVSLPTHRIDLRDETGREPAYGLSRFLPVYGDGVLPDHPVKALAKGVGAKVDLLIGANSDEMNLYFVPTGVRRKIGGLLAIFFLSRAFPKARAVLKAYGLGRKGTLPGDALTKAMTDLVFRLPTRTFAAAHQGRTHLYEFDWRSPAFDDQLGACHGLELPFVFNTLASCTGPKGVAGPTPPPQALADRVHALWVDFAKTGALPWPEYDAETRQVHLLSEDRTITDPEMPAAAFSR